MKISKEKEITIINGESNTLVIGTGDYIIKVDPTVTDLEISNITVIGNRKNTVNVLVDFLGYSKYHRNIFRFASWLSNLTKKWKDE